MITIIEYGGEEPLQNYIIGEPNVTLLLGYSCGCWMCTDTNRGPGFCPHHGMQAVACHEMNQEIFEHCLQRSTMYTEINPRFKNKKVGEK